MPRNPFTGIAHTHAAQRQRVPGPATGHVSPLQAGVLTHTRTLPPYAHPALTPYSGVVAKLAIKINRDFKKVEAFFKESHPWGTGKDSLGGKSTAGVSQVAQLRTQIEQVKEAMEVPLPKVPTPKPTPKPPRVAKRDRPDDEDDMDALDGDESPDSSTLAQVKLETEFNQLKADLANMVKATNELAKVILR